MQRLKKARLDMKIHKFKSEAEELEADIRRENPMLIQTGTSERTTTTQNPKRMRQIILQQSKRANVGHIGSCLCVVEILSALYESVLRIDSPSDPDRDRFILSKGHAALALYAALSLKGWLSTSVLDSFCGDGSLLGVHPECQLPGIDFSAGSLGHGLSIAAGAAFAAKMQNSARRVFCLISDAECNEGSVWEAVMFSAHHRLHNLTVVIDVNGQQAMGPTYDVLDLSNLKARWESFGWRVTEADGHSVDQLTEALRAKSGTGDPPHAILAKTCFGHGVSYMMAGKAITQTHLPDGPINWHYLPMSDEEYDLAMAEVEKSH
jgi:transketolase